MSSAEVFRSYLDAFTSGDVDGAINLVTDDFGTVGGGAGNRAGNADEFLQRFSTVGGGEENVASAARSTVGGGALNSATGNEAAVAGGFGNRASGGDSTVGGGDQNLASAFRATVGGGFMNAANTPAASPDTRISPGWRSRPSGRRTSGSTCCTWRWWPARSGTAGC